MTSAFEIYLRTGRRVAPAAAVETKFNPWHDPDDGRFAFSGQGRYFPGRISPRANKPVNGIRGRGGSYGGGGASESWEPKLRPEPSLVRAKRPRVPASTGRNISLRQQAPAPDPRFNIHSNGYDFSIDAHARQRQISGELTLQSQLRSRRAQADAGKPDRRATDDGGHYIAARFNGPREWFNHFAQDANFNRGSYRALEDKWVKAI